MGRGKLWTSGEMGILEQRLKEGKSCEEIAHELGRPLSSVKMRAMLFRDVKRAKWSSDEIELIRNNKDKTDKELAEMLGRSENAVVNMRSKLGLVRVPKWKPEEDELVRSGLSVREIALKLNRSPAAVYMRRFKLGLSGRLNEGG